MFTAIVVDDEFDAREALKDTISRFFPQIKILGEASGIKGLKQEIIFHKPDILFLDVMLGSKNIIQFLPELDIADSAIIFTTAHDDYVLQAIRFSALDYLLKPIDKEELQKALDRLESQKSKILRENMEIFKYNLDSSTPATKKIALPTNNKLEIVSLSEIVYCESDGAYTVFHLTDKRKILVSKNLHEFEKQFFNCGFCRVHHSHLINISHIKTYIKGEGGSVIMSDGNELEISRRKKGELMSLLLTK
jgi:two-component system LytT family response regulator